MGRYQMIKPYTYKVYEDADCKKCARKFFSYLESNSIANNNNFITLRDIDTNQTYTFEHKKRTYQHGGAQTTKQTTTQQPTKQQSAQNTAQNTAQDTAKNTVHYTQISGDKASKADLEKVENRVKNLEVKVDALVGGSKEECKGLICPPGKNEEICVIQ
jgi:hypothetical protein